MTLKIHLPPEKAAALNAEAQALGLSVEQWVQRLVDERLQSAASESDRQQVRRPLSARIRELWADMPDDVRAAFPEGGARQIDHHVYGLPKR